MLKIVLASASPRRREILENLGLEFEIVVSDVDESSDIQEPELLVKELSNRKAESVYQSLNCPSDTLVIGCDSVVVSENEIFGKPKDRQDAKRMLSQLQDSKHSVISGLTLIYNGKTETAYEETFVLFDKVSEAEMDRYIATGECEDKAGAYAIQGKACKWIKGINGCYYNVVGLPVHLMYELAKKLDLGGQM
ncbi:MAG: septum formation protein Maf [Clostridia bacterium]|nr:septum formation protein Maf [Clostridia bacterium]